MVCGRCLWLCGVGLICFITNFQTTVSLLLPSLQRDSHLDSEFIIEGRDLNPLESVDVKFQLFTRNNPVDDYFLETNNFKKLRKSPINLKKLTKIIIHGWLDGLDERWMYDLRDKYLAVGDFNVIIVNWNAIFLRQFTLKYELIQTIGEEVSKLIRLIYFNQYILLKNVHILGHSIGAHIAGSVGSLSVGEIGRITALDPTGAFFEYPFFKSPSERLDPSDAQFVDVIHTCAGIAGFSSPLGHVDFYPNGGVSPQPGCSTINKWICSHLRAIDYMLESIESPNRFIARKCDSWIDYTSMKCINETTTFMGENVNLDSKDLFFLETNEQYPYGKNL